MQDLWFSNEFLGMTSKPQATKEKTDNCTSSNKLLCLKDYYQESEKTTCRMRKKLQIIYLIMYWYLENKEFYNSETNNSIQKWAMDVSRHFSKDDAQMSRKNMKRSLCESVWKISN